MIMGLPAHPLLVHFTISLLVLLPLGVLVSIVWAGMRKRLDWLLPLGAVVACLLTLATGNAGTALEESLPVRLASVQAHGEWGQWAMRICILFAVSVVLWWASVTEEPLSWADKPFLRSRGMRLGLTVLVGIVSVATLVIVTLTGHSGATAVWGS